MRISVTQLRSIVLVVNLVLAGSLVYKALAAYENADLRAGSLRRADLRGTKGFHLLPVADPRGYVFAHAVLCGDVWRVRIGCRDFTIAEAREHWGASYQGERWIGDMYLHALDWFEERALKDGAGAFDDIDSGRAAAPKIILKP